MNEISSTRSQRAGGPGRRGGFTLIELMVAMVIMAVGFSALVQMGLVTVRGHSYSREWMEAYDIAQSVLEDLRARAQQWVTQAGCQVTDVNNVLPANVGGTVKAAGNTDLQFADMASWPVLQGNIISNGGATGLTDSLTANIFGLNDSTGANVFQRARSVYRVHFVAHRIPYSGLDVCGQQPNAQMIRITVFVSWDNKDHGNQDVAWDTYNNEQNFWKRHMVSMTTFVTPEFRWGL